IECAISAAERSNVKQLALFHHDPMRTDAQIDQLFGTHCAPDRSDHMVVFFAREGLEVKI
ncbi:MAG: MBL fold metallo-hydrolase, partial [Candidatus Hodarchaeota archaeon]